METMDTGNGGTLVGNPQSGKRQIEAFDPTDPNPNLSKLNVIEDNHNTVTLMLSNGRKVTIGVNNIENYGKVGQEKVTTDLKDFLQEDMSSTFTPSTAYQTQKAQEVKYMKHKAEVRDKDGIRTKDNFEGPRVDVKHVDVCPDNKSICPFTKERDERMAKPLVGTASKEDENVLKQDFNKMITASAKKELMEKTAMYDAVYMMPGKCQWCPKLRSAVSMHTCATVCPEGRRIPQKKANETYTDYLMKGGSDDGEVRCGLKDWMEKEMDKYYPGWLDDHIKEAGGEVAGSETNFGNRKMNLDPGERRHMPRYPEEKLVEKQLDERRHYNDGEIMFASKKAQQIKKFACKECGCGHDCENEPQPDCKCRICKEHFENK